MSWRRIVLLVLLAVTLFAIGFAGGRVAVLARARAFEAQALEATLYLKPGEEVVVTCP